MHSNSPIPVVFFRNENGSEPVRDWLKNLPKEERRVIGEDIKTAQFGWPLGMPLVKKITPGIWEIRSNLKDRISRVFLTHLDENLVLLHGFIKKTTQTPKKELELAKSRLAKLKGLK